MTPRLTNASVSVSAETRDGFAVAVEDARGVGQEDELFRLQLFGNLAGHQVGVDVV